MPLPTVSGNVLEVLLCYLYTGYLFARDDLNLGLDLMAAADQYVRDHKFIKVHFMWFNFKVALVLDCVQAS